MKKICVLFPGMGYTNLKPLLYYSGKLALSKGYELHQINYMEMPPKVGRDPKMMKLAYEVALAHSTEQLSGINWQKYDQILLVGKSVGTAVMASYAQQHIFAASDSESKQLEERTVKMVYLTPPIETYNIVQKSVGIAFHGNSDPWADTDRIIQLSEEYSIPLHIYEGGNHSLETGNVATDIGTVRDVMSKLEDYI